MLNINERIAFSLNIRTAQVSAAITLLDEGSTIPFIARYRKEVTGNLTDEELRALSETLLYLRNLEARMKTVLTSIKEQDKLTPELEQSILKVETLAELEDLYRPYKPRRKTRASIAREKGLTPLAEYVKAGVKTPDYETYVASFINEEKGVMNVTDAFSGAQDIICEEISDVATYRKFIKNYLYREGMITSLEVSKDEKDTYGQYKDYKEKLATIPPHRILAINRGEKVKALKVSLLYEVGPLENRILSDFSGKNAFISLLHDAIKDALKRLILPSVENEIRSELMEKAENASLVVFKKNVEALLLYPPLKNKVILGFDPGFRTGGKYAVVNEQGVPLTVGVVYLFAAGDNQIRAGQKEIIETIKKYKVDLIALGNGTASRESEAELTKLLNEHNLNLKLYIVNESGASVYSASKVGAEEFPSLTVEKRSAISLARRLQDPLSELVKIDPKAIGVGQYQHDMNQTKLTNALSGVVEDVVNTVGVNLNNASVELLKYVAGINKTVASNIITYIAENGPFKSRSELKKVSKLGAKAYEQAAGFLRIYDGKEELDSSAIHPESYPVAKHILKTLKINLRDDDQLMKENAILNVERTKIMAEFSIGAETLHDILEEIKRPGRDIRDDVEIVELNNEVKDIKDLKIGMILHGTVRNIMDFGMFIDINVHQDGLVHISEVSNTFVTDISSLHRVNDVVKVKVIGVDVIKKRISLSIKQV